MALQYDIIIFGGGIAGLWVANTLKTTGYNPVVIEKGKLGAGQTLASQGMIHGGRKYGAASKHAAAIKTMPGRWDLCFGGQGEIDLTDVKFLSKTQVMWPAGALLSGAALAAAKVLVSARMKKIERAELPAPLREQKNFRGPVYETPEKVLEVRSLIEALTKNLKGRLIQGEITELRADGQIVVSGLALRAQLIIFSAGIGNEHALKLLKIEHRHTQRRPLRQVMVRRLPEPLYGHGIVGTPTPRVTVTSHPAEGGGYIWYLGGAVAEKGAKLDEEAALAFARQELREIFPGIDWGDREWATWYGDRAEPLDAKGELPTGPFIYQCGRILLAWPTKLTFAPALSDLIFERLKDNDIHPIAKTAPPPLPAAEIGSYPWEAAVWRRLP